MGDPIRPVRHFVNDARGGIAAFVSELIDAQRQRAARPVELCGPAAIPAPADIRRLIYRPNTTRWGLNQWKFAGYALINRGRKSVVRHSHQIPFESADLFTVHGFYTHNWLRKHPRQAEASLVSVVQFRLLSWLELRALRGCPVVTFVSTENRAYVEQELRIRRDGHFHVIAPGVNLSRFKSVDENQKRRLRQGLWPRQDAAGRWLLFVGNDFRGKGLFRILEALIKRSSAAAQSRERYHLLVYGHDALCEKEVRELAAKHALAVTFEAPDDSLPAAYAASDFLLMDSVSEGFPLVLLEAMRSGCVPAVTLFGGVRDVIVHGRNGWIGKDAEEIVSTALQTSNMALGDLSRAAVVTASARDWSKVAEQFEDIYRTL